MFCCFKLGRMIRFGSSAGHVRDDAGVSYLDGTRSALSDILSTSTSCDGSNVSLSEDRVSREIDEWCLNAHLHSVLSPSTSDETDCNAGRLWTASMLDGLAESHLRRIHQFALDFLPILKESRRRPYSRRSRSGGEKRDGGKDTRRIQIPTLFNNEMLCTLENISLTPETPPLYDVWSSYINLSYSDLT